MKGKRKKQSFSSRKGIFSAIGFYFQLTSLLIPLLSIFMFGLAIQTILLSVLAVIWINVGISFKTKKMLGIRLNKKALTKVGIYTLILSFLIFYQVYFFGSTRIVLAITGTCTGGCTCYDCTGCLQFVATCNPGTNTACDAGYYCTSGSCVAKIANGGTCNAGCTDTSCLNGKCDPDQNCCVTCNGHLQNVNCAGTGLNTCESEKCMGGANPICDEQAVGSPITVSGSKCTVPYTYFSDRCGSGTSCAYEDDPSVCRSSAYDSSCTANVNCNGRAPGAIYCYVSLGDIYQCTAACANSLYSQCTGAWAATDTDAGDDFDTAGTCHQTNACTVDSQTTCPYTEYSDSCAGSTLTEYYPSGYTCASKNYNCCDAGYYTCTSGACIAAGAGYYSPAADCNRYQCSAGYYGSSTTNSVNTCNGACSAGYYCPAGSTSSTQNACGLGHYCPAGSGTYTNCPAGTYGSSTTLSTSACSGQCSAGYYCPAGSTSATQNNCGAGNYCPAGSGSATPCPAGTYGSTANLQTSACSGQCACGHYCPAGSTSSTQTDCSAGTYRASTGGASQSDCTLSCTQGSGSSGYCWTSTTCYYGCPSQATYCTAVGSGTTQCCPDQGDRAEGVGCSGTGATGTSYNRDTTQGRCEDGSSSGCTAYTWLTSQTDGTTGPCCGNDGSSDIFENAVSGSSNPACVSGAVVTHDTNSTNGTYAVYDGAIYHCGINNADTSGYSFVIDMTPNDKIGSLLCGYDGLWTGYGGGVVGIRGKRVRPI